MFDEDITLQELVAMLEEWKPFPKDKVNRQIDKAKDKGDESRAKQMTAVKNFRTKMTYSSKANQKFTGKDTNKQIDKELKHQGDAAAKNAEAKKQEDKLYGKAVKAKNIL